MLLMIGRAGFFQTLIWYTVAPGTSLQSKSQMIPFGLGWQPLSMTAPFTGEINTGAGGGIGGAEETSGVGVDTRKSPASDNRPAMRRRKVMRVTSIISYGLEELIRMIRL